MIRAYYQNQEDLRELEKVLKAHLKNNTKPLAVVCIGSDRATGDCIGPITGELLTKRKKIQNRAVTIFGTLNHPVHAKNLHELNLKNYYVIAIDACLGAAEKIGEIKLIKGSIEPGLALNKKLDPIGDLSILAFVNVSSQATMSILQSTRLNLIMRLSETICDCICNVV